MTRINKDAYWWKLYHEKAISKATLREMLFPPLWGPKDIDPLIVDDLPEPPEGRNKAMTDRVTEWYRTEQAARKEKPMSTTAHFQGGPLDGITRTLPDPVPEYGVPVFKDLPGSIISGKTIVEWEDFLLASKDVVYERWAQSSQDSWYRVKPQPKLKSLPNSLPYIEDPAKEEKLITEEYVKGLIAAVRAVKSKIYVDRRGSLPPYAAQHVNKSQLLLSEILIELKYALMAIDGGR